jgi:hypothetical protein
MASLYVLGARQRSLLLKHEEEWSLYEAALILHIDTESGAVRTCVDYTTPLIAKAAENSSSVFKSGTIAGNTLYACTSTEVLLFRLPAFEVTRYISLPCFNDLHHVVPASDGTLLAAVTGLDMVARFTTEGELVEAWSVLPEPAWSRFSQTIDYRKIESTKPHKSHPNFVFELDGKIWVTRFHQRDAICLNGSGRRIEIAVQSPHDGLVCGERIYFTAVDGQIVIANARSLRVESVVDLKTIDKQDALLGWCRGLLPLNDQMMWVGFTRIRKTRFRENILWVKNVLREGTREMPTHVALYDIKNRRCLKEFDLEVHGMNIVFSIFPAPPVSVAKCAPGLLTGNPQPQPHEKSLEVS